MNSYIKLRVIKIEGINSISTIHNTQQKTIIPSDQKAPLINDIIFQVV